MTNSAAGASVDNYYLGGYTPAQVKPPGKLDLISASAAKSGDRLQALFKIRVPGTGQPLAYSLQCSCTARKRIVDFL